MACMTIGDPEHSVGGNNGVKTTCKEARINRLDFRESFHCGDRLHDCCNSLLRR